MATDLIAKRQAAARVFVTECNILMAITGENAALLKLITDAGLVFADSDFQNVPGLAHLDKVTIEAAIARWTQLQTWLNTNGADVQKARP